MRRYKLLALAVLVSSGASLAQETSAGPAGVPDDAPKPVDLEVRDASATVLYGEPVRRIYTGSIDAWRIVDERRMILYTSPSRPYLLTLRSRAPRLRFNPIIGLRLRDRSLDARFDAIYVDGFPYAIERIERLTREVADQLLGVERDRKADGGAAAPEERQGGDSSEG